MLDLLAGRERPAGAIVKAFPRLTQPAVSRHLRVLREAGLVESRINAQQRIYTLRPGPLRELDQWISHYRRFWPEKIDALRRHLDRTRARKSQATEKE